MTDQVAAVTAALKGLGIPVIRAWPQAVVALPSCTVCVLEDRLGEDGVRTAAMGLTLRALMPEEADALAEQADLLLAAAGWRRTACKDGAERDGSCFHRALRYERTLPAPEVLALSVAGNAVHAAVLKREWERPVVDRTPLLAAATRLGPGRPPRQSLRVRITASLPGTLAKQLLAGPVSAGGQQWLAVGVTQYAGSVEAALLASEHEEE